MRYALLFLLAASLRADVVLLSGDLIGEHNSFGPNVAIAKHPEWSEAYPGSAWVSFAPTGYGDPFWPDTTVDGPPTASFFETFTLLTDGVGVLHLRADDTASVFLDSVLLLGPGHFTFRDDTGLLLPFTAGAGQHQFRFDLHQLAGNVTGINYLADITQTPEPSYLVLLVVGLLACVAAKRWAW